MIKKLTALLAISVLTVTVANAADVKEDLPDIKCQLKMYKIS